MGLFGLNSETAEHFECVCVRGGGGGGGVSLIEDGNALPTAGY